MKYCSYKKIVQQITESSFQEITADDVKKALRKINVINLRKKKENLQNFVSFLFFCLY